MKKIIVFMAVCLSIVGCKQEQLIHVDDICIRDPFICVDKEAELYYMYGSCANRDKNDIGVEVYVSKDLENWTLPTKVLTVDELSWGNRLVWAPEVHVYNDKYYLFVTLTGAIDTITPPVAGVPLKKRATQIFVSDSPKGPFLDLGKGPQTPTEWMALDGTLHVEDGKPYMIFCHEWVQIVDGSMDYVELSPDFSEAITEPVKMFHASEAAWSTKPKAKVTDGCFTYRTKTGKLLMIWSSFGKKGYAIGIAESESGKLCGPWIQQEDLLFERNGGHGMIFTDLDGRLLLTLHQPNRPEDAERMKLFELEDVGSTLIMKPS